MTPDEAAGMTVAALSAMRTMQAESGRGPCEAAAPLGALAVATGSLWRERALAAEARMAFMTMSREYWEDMWDGEKEARFDEAVRRHNAAIAATENNGSEPTAMTDARPRP